MAKIRISSRVEDGSIYVSVNVYFDKETSSDVYKFLSYQERSSLGENLGFDNQGVYDGELMFSKRYEWGLQNWQKERKNAIKEAKSLIALVSDVLSDTIPDFLPDEEEIIEVEQPLYKDAEE